MNKMLRGILWLILLLFSYKFLLRQSIEEVKSREKAMENVSPLTPYKRIIVGNGLKTIECCDERNLYVIFDNIPRTENDFIPSIKRDVRPILRLEEEEIALNDNTLYLVTKSSNDGKVVVKEMDVDVRMMLRYLNLGIF